MASRALSLSEPGSSKPLSLPELGTRATGLPGLTNSDDSESGSSHDTCSYNCLEALSLNKRDDRGDFAYEIDNLT